MILLDFQRQRNNNKKKLTQKNQEYKIEVQNICEAIQHKNKEKRNAEQIQSEHLCPQNYILVIQCRMIELLTLLYKKHLDVRLHQKGRKAVLHCSLCPLTSTIP
jgi:hypothetical protein